jgi:microcystin-dependent protein
MPTDANGNYALPGGYLAVAGTTILPSQHNPPLEDVASGLTARLMRSGAGAMTGQLKSIDGSVGAPGYTFGTALTTGLYKTAAGFGVSIAGTKVAEFTSTGLASGARFIGELIAHSGQSALPPLTVYPAGQTLSRATYAALWTFAQAEIATGNSFYNNGDGTTTFGIGDLRGRVVACKDSIFSVAGRLTSAGGGIDGGTFGAAGGSETQGLTLAQLPTGITSANAAQAISVTSSAALLSGTPAGALVGTGSPADVLQPGTGVSATRVSTGNNAISVTSNNTSGAAHRNVQPTIVCIYLLFAGA